MKGPNSEAFPMFIVVVESLSCVRLFAAPWTVARHAPLSMEFPRQEYWSLSCHFLLLGDLPDPGIEPESSALTGRLFTTEPPGIPFLMFTFRSKFFLF